MVFESKELKLKDGRTAVVRSPQDCDIPGMLDYLYVSAGETDFILRYPEECGKYTPEGEKALFDRVNASDNEVMLVAVVDGKIAGSCDICRGTYLKTRHRAQTSIAILSEFWGLGLGTALFKELIGIAERDPYITQLELDFVEGNARAQALYEKMGYRIIGEKPGAIRLKDGTLLSEFSMILEVKR